MTPTDQATSNEKIRGDSIDAKTEAYLLLSAHKYHSGSGRDADDPRQSGDYRFCAGLAPGGQRRPALSCRQGKFIGLERVAIENNK